MKLRPVLPTLRPEVLSLRPAPQATLPFPLGRPRTQLWYLGRNAIYAALEALGLEEGESVIVPSYTNGVEVAAIAARGLVPRQVRVRSDFSIDVDDLDRLLEETGARLVLAVHYLGFAQPIDAIMAVARRHGARVFEDCALSFLARFPDGRPVGSVGDLAVYSVYKTLPVPDGALLVVNDPSIPMPKAPLDPQMASSVSGLGRLVLNGARMGGPLGQGAASALDLSRRAAAAAFARAKVERTAAGSMRFETKRLPWGASRFTRAILPRLDYAAIVERRRRNFLRLRERLADVPTFFDHLPAGACPLFYPVIVEDKEAVMRHLATRNIETVNFWSTWHPSTPPDAFPEIAHLRAHVVELPCLQDLDERDMDVIAGAVLEAIPGSLRADELGEPEDLRVELHAGLDGGVHVDQ